jgi:lysophospholipase L1-like esterase
MHSAIPLPKLAMTTLLAACLCIAATAETPQMQKVTTSPALNPLPMSAHGRVRTIHSNSVAGFGSDEYQSQWPGTYFKTAFIGRELYFRVGVNHEILHVMVDGQPPLVLIRPEPGVYRVSGLGNTPHTASVLVVTESQDAPNTFGGFAIAPGEKPFPTKRLSRQIEFIGDSYTVGYGNTSPKQNCTTNEVWATTDNSQAFGPLIARHYQADYQVNAISGRGIVRNYDGFAGDTVPTAYPYLLLDHKQPYPDPDWKPQIIVINLGTNDFSTPLHPGEHWKTRDELHADYEKSYVRFLQDLRAKNPDAYIILWTTGTDDAEIASEAQKVAQLSKAQGETKLSFIPIDHLSFTACDGHPSLADDQTIRDKVVQFIDAHPAIWQGK